MQVSTLGVYSFSLNKSSTVR